MAYMNKYQSDDYRREELILRPKGTKCGVAIALSSTVFRNLL
jgi:hypothetical protein